MSIVSHRPNGRLGNYLFMLAAAYGYAAKHGLSHSAPRSTHNHIWSPIYFPHMVMDLYQQGREDVLINELWTPTQQYQEIEFRPEWIGKQIVLNGYWQSWKYYDHCKKQLIEAIGLPWEMHKGVAAIHVRRGDYLQHPTKHPPVTMEYISKAIELFRSKKGIKLFKFFSDDIAWCITSGVHLLFPDCEFEYSTGKSELEDLVGMSCCEHIAMSNSTMSWWGAELNKNPGKVVVCPDEDNWFGPDNKHLTVKDLYRNEWLRIQYKYEQRRPHTV